MATIFCASGGSNTAPYETWAKAATSLQTALTAASSSGDVVVLQYNAVPSGDKELAADTTYTFAAHCALVAASNDGGSAYTLRAMAADSDWIGNSTTNRYIRLAGADLRVRTYGLTFRTAGSTLDQIAGPYTTGGHHIYENTYYWVSNSATGGSIILAVDGSYLKLINPTFRFGATGQYLLPSGAIDIIGGVVSSAGSAPTDLFRFNSQADVQCTGTDLAYCTGNLVANSGFNGTLTLDRCKLGNGVTPLAAQTSNPNRGSPEVFIYDSAYGDVQGFYGHYDAQGQIETSTGIYKTTNTTGNRSWKITTTANCSYLTPYVAHGIDVYNTATASITPYLEILRDGSTTAFKDNEVWAEFTAKTTSGYATATEYGDSQALAAYLAGTAGSDQAAGTGTGNWTGQSGTAWSGKIDSGSAFTPAEAGSITASIHVGVASATVYVDPEIRGL